jgi:hypothetical protein
MVCETINLFARRRIHTGLRRLPARELLLNKGDNILMLTDYQARRKAISDHGETSYSLDSNNDEYEEFTLFP